jgi:predicted phage tail protein
MNKNLVKITLCDDLAKRIGKNEYNLNVQSVSEAITAINALTNGKFLNIIKKSAKEKRDYALLVNGLELESLDEITITLGEELKSIEIVPSVKGGVWMIVWMIISSLVSYGLNKILNPIPENKTAEENPSYLINGTVNLAKQGLPVPIGYGRKKIGSQVISYSTRYIDSSSALSSKNKLSWIRYIYRHKTENPFNIYYANHQEYVDGIIKDYGLGDESFWTNLVDNLTHPSINNWASLDPGNVFDTDLTTDGNSF